jgi:hypothetical protein
MYEDAEAYEAMMGRWSRQLAPLFINFVGVREAGVESCRSKGRQKHGVSNLLRRDRIPRAAGPSEDPRHARSRTDHH